MTKICSKCGIEKELNEFPKRKISKDGHASSCKICKKEWYEENKEEIAKRKKEYYKDNKEKMNKNMKEWYEDNKEEVARKAKEYRINNKERIVKREKKYRINNKEKLSKRKSKYYENNKDKIMTRHKEYYEENREKIKEYKKEYCEINKERIDKDKKEYYENNKDKIKIYYETNKEKILKRVAKHNTKRYHSDQEYNIKQKIRLRINTALKRQEISKLYKTIELLGCDFSFYKEYIEKQFTGNMTWGKLRSGKIHIDHILPCSSFDLTDPEEQKKCFNYSNTQPLWAEDNFKKGCKLECA